MRLCLVTTVLLACAPSSGPETGRATAEAPALATASGQTATGQTATDRVADRTPDPGDRAASADPAAPILVELFTSQGCNSCPPADALLSRLGRGQGAGTDRPIVPLAFHVDYWNYLGWSDPFSSASWSARQHRYAERVSGGRVYTPQLVVNGASHAVGSQSGQVQRAVKQAASTSAGPARVEVAAERRGDRIWVNASATLGRAGRAVIARAAVFENDVLTEVPRGENAGRTLENDYIVRALETVFEVPGDGEAGGGAIEIPIDPGWRPDHLGVAVFLQDRDTLEIRAVRAVAAGEVPVARR